MIPDNVAQLRPPLPAAARAARRDPTDIPLCAAPHTNAPATLRREFDEILVCTGSHPKTLPVKGFNKTINFSRRLLNQGDAGDRVVFVGGGQSAGERDELSTVEREWRIRHGASSFLGLVLRLACLRLMRCRLGLGSLLGRPAPATCDRRWNAPVATGGTMGAPMVALELHDA